MHDILKRAVEIWKPDFLRNFFTKNEPVAKTWKFWFFWNTVIAVILGAVTAVSFYNFGIGVQESIDTYVPDDGSVVLEEGELSLNNIEQPIVIDSEGGLLIIDTTGTVTDEDIEQVQVGLYIGKGGFVYKEGAETRTFDFSEIDGGFEITKDELAQSLRTFVYALMGMIILFIWITITLFRLLTAFWWALLLWVGTLITKTSPKVSYMKCYFAVLNLYLIPLIVESILVFYFIAIPFLSTLIFLILFTVGIVYMKKQDESKSDLSTSNNAVIPGEKEEPSNAVESPFAKLPESDAKTEPVEKGKETSQEKKSDETEKNV